MVTLSIYAAVVAAAAAECMFMYVMYVRRTMAACMKYVCAFGDIAVDAAVAHVHM